MSDTFTTKLDKLFQTKQATHGESWGGYDDVARRMVEAGGPTVSGTYLWQLRTGRKTNLSLRVLEALARVFCVPAGYFFDDESYAPINEQLELIAKLRESPATMRLATRAADLSPEALRVIAGIVEHARRLEGLDKPKRSRGARARGKRSHAA